MIPQPASRSVVGASTAVGMSISCSHPNTLSGYLHTLSLFPRPMGALHFPHGDIYFSGHESLRLASHQNGASTTVGMSSQSSHPIAMGHPHLWVCVRVFPFSACGWGVSSGATPPWTPTLGFWETCLGGCSPLWPGPPELGRWVLRISFFCTHGICQCQAHCHLTCRCYPGRRLKISYWNALYPHKPP